MKTFKKFVGWVMLCALVLMVASLADGGIINGLKVIGGTILVFLCIMFVIFLFVTALDLIYGD